MPHGPGKYGANAEALLRKFDGKLCIVILMGGPDGAAFDVATSDPALLVAVPALLRTMAADIDRDMHRDLDAFDKHSRS